MKFTSPLLLNLLGNIFPYCPAVEAIRRINSSSIDLPGRQMLDLQLRMSSLWLKSGNFWGFVLGISLGLRLYFIVYPSSRHNTNTGYNDNKTKYSIQSGVDNLPDSMYSMNCIWYNTQCTIYSGNCTIILLTVYNAEYNINNLKFAL